MGKERRRCFPSVTLKSDRREDIKSHRYYDEAGILTPTLGSIRDTAITRSLKRRL